MYICKYENYFVILRQYSENSYIEKNIFRQMIVDILVEKIFGIEIEEMPIYINALYVILGDD